jgi:ferredoxin
MAGRDHRVLKAWPQAASASLSFDGRPAPGLKPGRPVSRGQLLAISRAAGQGDLRAPFSGTVASLSPGLVELAFREGVSGQVPRPLDLGSVGGTDLAPALKSLGLDLPRPAAPGQPALISALDPEPGLGLARALWQDQRTTLQRGLALLGRLWPDSELVEVLPPRLDPLGAGRALRFREGFPMTLPSLLRMRVLGLPAPSPDGVVGPERLWALGTVARSGLPLTLIPVSVQGFHYLAPPGLRLSEVLAAVNLKPLLGDLALLGGLATGRPTARLGRGLRASDLSLRLIRAGRLPGPPAPCRLCGLCRQACPLGLPMDLAGQSPLEGWARLPAKVLGALAGCAGCGACALACPSLRPLLALAQVAGADDPYGRAPWWPPGGPGPRP